MCRNYYIDVSRNDGLLLLDILAAGCARSRMLGMHGKHHNCFDWDGRESMVAILHRVFQEE